MRKYQYDSDSNIYIGFTDSDLVTEDYTTTKPESDEHTYWTGSIWETPPAKVYTLEEYKLIKIKETQDYFDEILDNIKDSYAKFEPETWEVQRQEWLSWSSDENAPTPYCDMLAQMRDVSKDSLMAKVGAKAVGFAQLQGQLHSIVDAIEEASDEETIDYIMDQF